MVDAPEKIWADDDGVWHSHDCSEVLPCIEYVRADIAELAARRFRATEIRLERERDRERKHVGRLMREKEELRTQSDKFCDKYLAALKRAETAERQLAERDADLAGVLDPDRLASTVANIRQGESGTPRCEPPGYTIIRDDENHKATVERCAKEADDLSRDELFLDAAGRFGAELAAASIRSLIKEDGDAK